VVPEIRAIPLDIPDAMPADAIPLKHEEHAPKLQRAPFRYRKVNADICWHHDTEASAGLCAGCRLPFCASCLVELRGHFVCGACKNFRIAAAGQPIRNDSMALVALISALVAGPVALGLSLVGAGLFFSDGVPAPTVLLSVVALFPVGGVLGLSLWVLRRLEGQTRLSGRGMALGGACISFAALFWCLSVIGFVMLGTGGGG
jgi:hypothetical protein